MDLLIAENAALHAQLAEALTELAASRLELSALRKSFDALAVESARSNERLAELTAVLTRRQSRTPKPPAPPAPPDLDEMQRAAYDQRPKPPAPTPRTPKSPKPRKPTGRKALPDHLPTDEHVLRPDTCGACGGTKLDLADEVVEEKLDFIQAYHRRRVVRRKTCRCRDCGERTTARSLPAPYDRSKVTSAWLAWLVHMKFAMLVPLDRLRRDLATQRIPMATSTLVGFIERAADLLAAVDGHHWRQLLAGDWMATDATGLKVLVPQMKSAHNGYLEVYRRDDLVVMQYEPSKDAATVTAKLGAFEGTLVVDAEHRYNQLFTSNKGIIESGCNAHGRRKFRDAEAVQPALAAEGGAFISAIYQAEAEARANALAGDALKKWRQDRMVPIREKLRRWMTATKPTLVPSDPLAATIRYYENHWDALFRFIDNPLIPIDNSASEREFQNVAKLRLNMLFAGGTEGAHRAATLLGIVGTCRAIGVNSQAYLTWAFDRLGTHRDVYALPVEALTPAAFKAATSA
jgi:transposase